MPSDVAWMAAVEQSEWLEPTDAAGEDRRGRMALRIGGRRLAFVDEVTAYQPGWRIAHRTIEGPLPLDTACTCQPGGDGCRATVVGAVDRLPGGVSGRLAAPIIARTLHREFRAASPTSNPSSRHTARLRMSTQHEGSQSATVPDATLIRDPARWVLTAPEVDAATARLSPAPPVPPQVDVTTDERHSTPQRFAAAPPTPHGELLSGMGARHPSCVAAT